MLRHDPVARMRTGRSGEPIRLHGRDHEGAVINDLLDLGRQGRSAALALTGDSGVGKTALLEAARAAASGFTVLRARGVETESELAFAGLDALLRPVVGYLPRLPEPQAAALAAALGHSAPASGRDRFLASVALLNLLSEVAQDAPVLACIDDAQWLDGPSLTALAFTARRLDAEGVVMLFAVRDVLGDDGHPLLPEVPCLAVSELGEEAGRLLLADILPDDAPEAVRAGLLRAARGNPLALVEMTRSLIPDQLAGTARLPEPPPVSAALSREYSARVRRLPDATRWLLLMLAADEQLDADQLEQAAAACGHTVEDLRPAEDDGLVRLGGDGAAFRHPLIRSAVYHGEPIGRRRSAHRLLAELFTGEEHRVRRTWHLAAAAAAPDAELAAAMEAAAMAARERSGYGASSTAFEHAAELTPDPALRARRLTAAARDAWLAGRPARAHTLLDRAVAADGDEELLGVAGMLRGEIELRDGLASDARDALLTAARHLMPLDAELGLRALLAAGDASSYAGDPAAYRRIADEVTRRYARGGVTFMDADRNEDLARSQMHAGAVRTDAGMRLIFDYFAGMSAAFQGDLAGVVSPLRRVVEAADGMDDPRAVLRGSVACLMLGDGLRAYGLAARAVAIARSQHAVAMVPQALEYLVYASLRTGRLDTGKSDAAEGLRLARDTGQLNCASHLQGGLALLTALAGDEEECLAHCHEAGTHAVRHGLGLPAALVAWARAALDLGRGDPASAAARLRSMARSGPGHGHTTMRLISTPWYVEAAARTGDKDRARAAFTGFDRWARATDSAMGRAEAARCRALVTDDAEATEAAFEEALELHGYPGGSDFERARTELLYGTALRRQRRPGDAREHLIKALEIFEYCDARLWTEQTRAQLRANGEQPRSPDQRAVDQLTPQQLQIARYVAQGSTNREVAAILFVSPRTVDHHLRNIFAKLGIRSRTDLARLIP